jgi:hypothetical protein
MISVSNLLAKLMAKEVLPTAVGPTIAISVFLFTLKNHYDYLFIDLPALVTGAFQIVALCA